MLGRSSLSCMWLAAAACMLSGCLDDNGVLADHVASTVQSREKFAASAVVNVAMAEATGQAGAGVLTTTERGAVAVSSMLCPYYDGTSGGVFLTWPKSLRGLSGGAMAAEMASQIAPEYVSTFTAGGALYREGQDVADLPGCELPALDAGTPVVVMPVRVPSSELRPANKTEQRLRVCPAGLVGYAVDERLVVIDSTGRANVGPWENVREECKPVPVVSYQTEDVTPEAWSNRRDSVPAATLADQSPTSCKRVTVKSETKDEAPTRFVVDTCNAIAAVTPAPLAPIGPHAPAPTPAPRFTMCHLQATPFNMNGGRKPAGMEDRGFVLRPGGGTNAWSWGVLGAPTTEAYADPHPCPAGHPQANPNCSPVGGNLWRCRL